MVENYKKMRTPVDKAGNATTARRLADIFQDPHSQDEMSDLATDLLKRELQKALEYVSPDVFFQELVPEMERRLQSVSKLTRPLDWGSLILATAISINLQHNGNNSNGDHTSEVK